jgi:hypothetical protein
VVADVAERRLRRARLHERSMCRKTHARLQRARLAVRGLTATRVIVIHTFEGGDRVARLSIATTEQWTQRGTRQEKTTGTL